MRQIALILLASFLIAGCKYGQQATSTEQSSQTQQEQSTQDQQITFTNPKKSAHYVSNSPEHGSTLTAAPKEAVINFNFDLATNSTISVTSGGKTYSTGNVIFDANKRAMRIAIDPNAPDGLYTVNYNACWPDKSCHDGNFQFAIKKS